MSEYFLDSSALLERYVSEQGTIWIRQIARASAGNVIFIAEVTTVEIVSAISRKKREGQYAPRAANLIRQRVDEHARLEYKIIYLTPAICTLAEDLLEKHPLRAYDAVQLGCAITLNTSLIQSGLNPIVFLSADVRLLIVATAEGLTTDNPNNYP